MQQTDLAYLAGLLDGEACFGARLTNRGRHGAESGNVELRITVQSTSAAMINRIIAIYDELGIVYAVEIGRMMAKSTRPAHRVDVRRRAEVETLLRAVFPYLVVKRPEAEMMLKWLAKWRGDMRGGRGSNKAKPSFDERVVFIKSLSDAKKTA